MLDAEDLAFHEESFREYLAFWNDSRLRATAEMTEADAAYHVFEHGGLLQREGGKAHSVMQQLRELPMDECIRLVRAACQFTLDFSLPDHLARVFGLDLVDPDEMAEIEHVLVQRDALDAALRLAILLVGDCVKHDDELLADLATACCVGPELDDTLLTRPDIIGPASRILQGISDPATAATWLRKARAFDERFQEPTLAEFRRKHTESTSDAGIGALPHAVSLLLRRTQEIAAQTAEFRIAASAGARVGPAAGELLDSTYPVEGDDAVKVRFSIEPGSNCRHQFRIVLVAPTPALERYRSAAIKFKDGSVCSIALGLGSGGVELLGDEIAAMTSLTLLEESGERHHVDLNCCHE